MSNFTESYISDCAFRAKKIYLASPWFNDSQMERMKSVLSILRVWEAQFPGRKVYAPYEELVCPATADSSFRSRVYLSNMQEVSSCDIIVAITDEKDIGTIFELGAACANRDISIRGPGIKKPVCVGVALTLGDKPFNLMLAEGLDVVCKDLNQLSDYVMLGKIPKFNNEIE